MTSTERRSIVLFGMMGSGKTTVARIVGQRLGRQVLDTDALVETVAGRTVAEVFAGEGESGFRRQERTAVDVASARDGAVISVGGGTVMDEHSVTNLKRAGILVWLDVPLEVLLERVGDDPERPLAAQLRQLLHERRDRYAEVADHVVDASGTPEEVADLVIAAVGGAAGVEPTSMTSSGDRGTPGRGRDAAGAGDG